MTHQDYQDEMETLACRNMRLRKLCRSQSGVIQTLYAELDRLRLELARVKREKRELRQRLGMYSAKYREDDDTVYEATNLK